MLAIDPSGDWRSLLPPTKQEEAIAIDERAQVQMKGMEVALSKATSHYLELGNCIQEMHNLLQGSDSYQQWLMRLSERLNRSISVLRDYRQVAEAFQPYDSNVVPLLGVSTLVELSRNDVPPEVRDRVIARAERGQVTTLTEAKQLRQASVVESSAWRTPLLKRNDLTEPEQAIARALKGIDDCASPHWEQLLPCYQLLGPVVEAHVAKSMGYHVGPGDRYLVIRPDLGDPFPLHLKDTRSAWYAWQDGRDKWLALCDRKPAPDPNHEARLRMENDYYPTPTPVAAAAKRFVDGGLVFEPCAGCGKIAEQFEGCVTNELYPQSSFSADYTQDALDPQLWDRVVAERGSIDWVVTNPPFGDLFPTKLLTLIRSNPDYARRGVALLLRVTWIEPCSDRQELLQDLSDNLRWFMPVNPRPRCRKDTEKTDSCTLAWFVWDFRFSWKETGIESPFQSLTNWKE